MAKEESSKKVGYDARKPFSELLIELIKQIMDCSKASDLPRWELLLRNYFSLTHKFISSKEREEINGYYLELQRCRKYKNHSVYADKDQPSQVFLTKAPMILMHLQERTFYATSHLLVPSQESDDDADFDTAQILGGKSG